MELKTTYINTSKCPTQKELEQYVFSNMNPAEQHTIEKHLLNCKVCDDAVEGLMLLKDEKELTLAASNINSKIDYLLAEKKSKKSMIIAIAAGLALLVGITFYFSNENNEQLASTIDELKIDSNQNNEPLITAELKEENTNVDSQKNEIEVLLKPNKSKQLADAEISGTTKNVTLKTPPVISREDLSNDVVYEIKSSAISIENNKLANEIAANDDSKHEERQKNVKALTKVSSDAIAANAENMQDMPDVNKKSESDSKAKESTNLKDVIPASAGKKYEASPQAAQVSVDEIAEFKSRKLDKPLNERAKAESSYKSGLVFFANKKFDRAIKCFDDAMKYPNAGFYDDAEFEKAKCLVEIGKKDDAKKIFQSIITKKGKHKQEAEKILLDSF